MQFYGEKKERKQTDSNENKKTKWIPEKKPALCWPKNFVSISKCLVRYLNSQKKTAETLSS